VPVHSESELGPGGVAEKAIVSRLRVHSPLRIASLVFAHWHCLFCKITINRSLESSVGTGNYDNRW
jgi:hypothetical protein